MNTIEIIELSLSIIFFTLVLLDIHRMNTESSEKKRSLCNILAISAIPMFFVHTFVEIMFNSNVYTAILIPSFWFVIFHENFKGSSFNFGQFRNWLDIRIVDDGPIILTRYRFMVGMGYFVVILTAIIGVLYFIF